MAHQSLKMQWTESEGNHFEFYNKSNLNYYSLIIKKTNLEFNF